jgi:hypothetical protein
MATTTNYGWTTPDDTALVKDGAAAIRTLGSSVDTTTKALNPSTTLGDIEYRSSTANTNTRLGIGTTGQVLTVAGGVPSWATAATPSSGLTLIGTTTFTTSSAVNINTVFSTTYDNYRVLIDLVGSTTNMNIAWRFRVSGADNTTSNYNFSEIFSFGTTVSGAGQNAQSSIPRFTQYSVDRSYVAADVFTPFTATPSSITANSNLNYAAGFHGLISNGQFSASTSFDGFSLIPSTGTITGKVTVYGYAK